MKIQHFYERLLTELLLVVFQSDTCYADGTFIIDVVIPAEYPFKPPKVSKEGALRKDLGIIHWSFYTAWEQLVI